MAQEPMLTKWTFFKLLEMDFPRSKLEGITLGTPKKAAKFASGFYKNCHDFYEILGGFARNPDHRDCFLPFCLEALEIFMFSLFLNAEIWSLIGAWLGFEVVAQWGHWRKNRQAFNRFLIGTALTLIFSAWFAEKLFGYALMKELPYSK